MDDRIRRAGAAMIGALLLGTLLAGCGGGSDAGTVTAPVADSADLFPTDPVDSTPAAESTPSPTPTPAASPSVTPRPKKATKPTPAKRPKPKRSANAPIRQALPPPVPRPSPTTCKPTYVGTQASRAEAKAALTAAAERTYWPTSAPSIRVPLNLVKATAWQESGWQSNIVACDGGIGLMQVMKPTAEFVNNRFGQSNDINDYRDNATLGANYLAWLIKYFGDVYFEGDYELVTDGDCASSTDLCLLNAVVASYNFGFGTVDTADGLVIPNPQYVRNVRALMTECVCLDF